MQDNMIVGRGGGAGQFQDHMTIANCPATGVFFYAIVCVCLCVCGWVGTTVSQAGMHESCCCAEREERRQWEPEKSSVYVCVCTCVCAKIVIPVLLPPRGVCANCQLPRRGGGFSRNEFLPWAVLGARACVCVPIAREEQY